MAFILVSSVVGFGLLLVVWGIYQIGYSSGYQDGRERELDKSAQRYERTKRFGGSYD